MAPIWGPYRGCGMTRLRFTLGGEKSATDRRKNRAIVGRDRFEQIVASLHEAMLDDSHWLETSALIDDACGSKGNHLTFSHRTSPADIDFIFTRFCYGGEHRTDLEQMYFDTYLEIDDHLPAVRKLPDGKLVHATGTIPEGELAKSLAYHEIFPRFEFRNGLTARLDGPGGSSSIFGVADLRDGHGWSSARIEMVERLLPHLRQFVRVRHALVQAKALATSVTKLLDTTGVGVVQLDRRGRILAANDLARTMLRTGDPLSDRDGVLRTAVPGENAQFQSLLRRALPPFGAQGESGSMVVTRRTELPHPALHVVPVRTSETDVRSWRVAALVLIVDARNIPAFDRALVQHAFGLTGAESEVAVMLAQGHSVLEIGDATGRKATSIRVHVKRILAKLGLHRQAQMVQMLMSFSRIRATPSIPAETEAEEESPQPPD